MKSDLNEAKPFFPWNKGRLVGQKAPLKMKEIWAIRIRLQLSEKMRDLALFNLAIDSKLRGCDLVRLPVCDISQGKSIYPRAIVMQRKTHRPVQFEITELTRHSMAAWIDLARLASDAYLFPSRVTKSPHLSTRQYARIVASWIVSIGLDPATYDTHTMRRTKATLIYRPTKNLRAVQLLLAQTKLKARCDTLASKSTMRWKWQSRQKREVCLQSNSASIWIVAVRPKAVSHQRGLERALSRHWLANFMVPHSICTPLSKVASPIHAALLSLDRLLSITLERLPGEAKVTMTVEVEKAFVAYPSRDPALASVIANGVAKANRMLGKRLRYTPWEFNDIAGNPLISPILDGIDASKFVVADITYLNPNVVYEVGFAIGRSRRCFLIRHEKIEGDRRIAREVGIFDTLGYDTYNDDDELSASLTAYVDPKPLAFSTALDRLAPVYVVEPPGKGGVVTVMTSRLKKARYKYRSFNPAEDARLSAADAVKQVAGSAGVLLYLEDGDHDTSFIHDTRSLFVAGLAHGMGKPTLVLAHGSAEIPLDVRDVVKRFTRPEDIIEHIASFSLEITEHLQQADPTPLRDLTPLQSLQIGDPTAENEMTTLGSYFLNTDQYSKAVRGEVNLVVGRKGTGKTALFLQVRDKTRADKRNVVLDLKPEGYQLLKLKEDILTHLSQGASHHLVTAFWEYLILLEITYKLLEKDQNAYKYNHEIRDLYLELEQTYKTEGYSVEGDFSERLLALSQRISQDYGQRFGETHGTKLSTDQVTELVYSHDVRYLRQQVSAYLAHKQSVWVLFDNLDKGWSTHGVDAVDALVLRCLIDAGRKVERDMRKDGHVVHCIAFIRNDVYEHLMRQSADYGKEMKVALDWTDPDMLREMLRLRLLSGLPDGSESLGFDQIWPQLCISHYKGEETSSYIIERSLMRPRNMIKMFSHAKGFAANLAHQKIQETDLEKGIRAYSQDLLVELDHELTVNAG